MTLAVLDTDAEVLALGPEWGALWRACPGATPFQSPAWLLPWWRCFGTGAPRVAVLRESGSLAGILACYVLDEPRCHKLLLMGAGISDYQDALIAPCLPDEALGALLSVVLARAVRDGVTRCDLTDLPHCAGVRRAPVPPDWQEQVADTEPCPVLPLPKTPEGLRTAIPTGKRRHLRQSLQRAARIGPWSTSVANASTLGWFLDELERAHAARWQSRGQAGVLRDPRVARFHRLAAPALQASGALRLQALSFENTVAAVYYTLLAGPDRILFYLSGFDPAFVRESPGTILLGRMIEDAVREGRRELHFLRGAEPYKYAWGGVDRMNTTRRLVLR